jgi:SAM-dependent methyltransferase
MSAPRYLTLATHYESCLAQHGDSHLGVDWPDAADAELRYRVMLDVIAPLSPDRRVRLLDFGCGTSALYDHILADGRSDIEYAGVDISERFIEVCRHKFPHNTYWQLDILTAEADALPRFDYAVINGVFTVKLDLTFDEMFAFFSAVVKRVFSLVDVGLAFNLITTHVDWERDGLFQVPLDRLARWLAADLSREFIIRHDYGLCEYTTYVYRGPVQT